MIPLLFVAAAILFNPSAVHAETKTSVLSQCNAPITYALGTLDSGFGLSRSAAQSALSAAAALWNSGLKGPLVTYVDTPQTGTVTVNFVYDTRQVIEQKYAGQRATLESEATTLNGLVSSMNAVSSYLENVKSQVAVQIANVKEKYAVYDQEVKKVNAQGGGTPEQVSFFNKRRVGLEAEQAAIRSKADLVNAIITTSNGVLNAIRSRQVSLNLEIEAYNTGVIKDDTHEGGQYIQQTGKRRIDIYAYSDTTKLRRILAHELGHALGLNHVTDRLAIMYAINEGKSLSLTTSDLEEFNRACGSR